MLYIQIDIQHETINFNAKLYDGFSRRRIKPQP